MEQMVANAINEQIRKELESSYVYLSMAAAAGSWNLKGVENWFIVQAKEEIDHAMGFYRHMQDRGGRIVLGAIAEPPRAFARCRDLFAGALEHERMITRSIHQLHEIAALARDYPLQSLLKWYIDEQVEEEATATEMLEKVSMADESNELLYLLDRDMAARAYKPLSPQAE